LARAEGETREELKSINSKIKENSEHLEVRIRLEDIAIAKVEQPLVGNEAFGEERQMVLFGLRLPRRVEIDPVA
jgi:hypothetical protein